jgi:tripartite-type tricarboxylate transporter receptor subunit TctC
MATQGTHGSNASLYKDLGYDTIADFTPISLVASTPLILVSNSKQPITNLRDLIDMAKAKPGVLNYGSSSVGGSPHLAMELLKMLTGIQMVHIPYQGSAPLRTALLSGDITVMFDNIPSSLPLVREGRFRALGVSGSERSNSAPSVPTVAQAGVPGFEVSAWYGLLASANTPPQVVAKLNGAIVQALRSKEVSDKLVDLGFQPVGSTALDFEAVIRTDLEKYRKLIKAAGITAQ